MLDGLQNHFWIIIFFISLWFYEIFKLTSHIHTKRDQNLLQQNLKYTFVSRDQDEDRETPASPRQVRADYAEDITPTDTFL